ncbi:MAG TPA: helix-turn-helix domain-containing protein [Vicinamibacterales bacterium]|nr:helix-turn-helix domain-containing protein [Vicinamibacterales bacterium]
MTMAEDRPVDFGTFLRQAREHRGVSLQDLAESTKISARVLESLERNDPSKLPGGIFSRAFVRAYAREVGLDPDVAVASFVTAFPDESGADEMPATTRAVEVESFEQRRRVVRVLVRLLGVAVLVAIVAFLYYSRFGPGAPAAKPAASQAPEGAASSAPPALPTYQAPATGPAPLEADGAAQPDAPPSTPSTADLQAAAPAAAEPAPAAGQASASEAPLVVLLAFDDACWFSVSVDGARTPSRTVAAGERIEFAVHQSITLTAGNAGALSMTLNGRPARALGAVGEVVTRTIPAARFESFLR